MHCKLLQGCLELRSRGNALPSPGGKVHIAHVIVIIQNLLEELPNLQHCTSLAHHTVVTAPASGTAVANYEQHDSA